MKKVKYCISMEGSEDHCGEFFVKNNTTEEEIQDITLVTHSSWEEIKDPPYGVLTIILNVNAVTVTHRRKHI